MPLKVITHKKYQSNLYQHNTRKDYEHRGGGGDMDSYPVDFKDKVYIVVYGVDGIID